jgi:hypothetical protein
VPFVDPTDARNPLHRYGIMLLTSFPDYLAARRCETFSAKAYVNLASCGRVFTLGFILEFDRTAPVSAADFARLLLANAAQGHMCTLANVEVNPSDFD